MDITDDEMKSITEGAILLGERCLQLGRQMNEHKLGCPKCNTRQIQLVGYIDVFPALWKCRKCKYEFEWEVI